MRRVSMQFEAYMDMSGSGPAANDQAGGFQGYWEPKPWEEAVCCMAGMDCWTGAFASAAGRATLEADLALFEGELAEAKSRYDELNADNLREEAEWRAQSLADSRALSAKLTNQLRDAETREATASAALAGLSGDDLTAAEATLAKRAAETKDLKDRKAEEDESFAS
jgi:hypothetical protein